MSWFVTLAVALASAVFSGALGLGIGLACVRWYGISGFEGKSGYFVVAVILLAAMAGFVMGLVTARLQGGEIEAGFGAVLLQSIFILAGIGLVVSFLAWLAAPPAAKPDATASATVDEGILETVPHTTLPAVAAPFAEWLEILRYNGNPDTRAAVYRHLRSRPALADELADAITGADDSLAYSALSALAELPADTLTNADALLRQSGEALIVQLRQVVAISVMDDPGYQSAATCALRWSGWMQAVSSRPAADRARHRPLLLAMVELAATRPDSVALASELATAKGYLARWNESGR